MAHCIGLALEDVINFCLRCIKKKVSEIPGHLADIHVPIVSQHFLSVASNSVHWSVLNKSVTDPLLLFASSTTVLSFPGPFICLWELAMLARWFHYVPLKPFPTLRCNCIISCIRGLSNYLSISGVSTKGSIHFSFPHISPISQAWIVSLHLHLVKATNYKVPFADLFILTTSYMQTSVHYCTLVFV